MKQLASIQILRGIAASAVVLNHALLLTVLRNELHSYGAHILVIGVDIFFVISGFIMWRSTESGDVGPKQFFASRLIRILPLYWIALITQLGALLLIGGLAQSPSLNEAVRAFLFIPYIDGHSGLNQPFLPPGWTLNCEMFFYLIFGSCLIMQARYQRFGAVATFFVALVAARVILHPTDPVAFRFTSPMLLEFLAGMGIAAVTSRRQLPVWAGVALLACATTFLLTAASHLYLSWPRFLYFGTPAAVIVLAFTTIERHCADARMRALVHLGAASYSIYLAHGIVFTLFHFFVVRGNQAFAMLFLLTASGISVGLLCFRYIETPLLNAMRKQFLRRSPHPLAVASKTGAIVAAGEAGGLAGR